MAMGVAFPVGFSLGKTMAWRKDRKARSVLTIGAVAFHTAFPPLLAFMLIVIFDRVFGRRAFISMRGLDWSVVSSTSRSIVFALVVGIGAAAVVAVWRRRVRAKEWSRVLPWIVALTVPVAVLVLRGDWVAALDILFWLSLPIIVVALLSVGEVTLIVDGAMAGVAREDYIFTARAKGLSERQVRDRHASRVALLPALSKLLVSLPFFLTGLMIIETAFAQPRYIEMAIHVPGLSSLMFSSLEARNVPMVIGGLLFVGLIMLGLRLLLDVLTLYLDPRIRYASSQGGG